jgi:predicted nucleic acid-binding Zn ribbon protein
MTRSEYAAARERPELLEQPEPQRTCQHCATPIPASADPKRIFCSKRCKDTASTLRVAARSSTNGTQAVQHHETNGTSTTLVDRLLDALGEDVATLTITTRGGVELIVRL